MGNGTMTVRNFTPHDITVILEDGTTQVFPSVGVIRARSTSEPVGMVGDIPVFRTTYGAPEGLPEEEEGAVLIVSSLAAQAIKAADPARHDYYVVSDTVRDEAGRIVGCRGFAVM